MKAGAYLLVIMSLFFLEACVQLRSSQPAPVIYVLHAPLMRGQQGVRNVSYVISVFEPEVPTGFDTDKIALYLYNGRRLDYYANAAWPEHLGKVLQDVIIRSARFIPDTIAVNPYTNIPAPYQLTIRVNDFEPVYKEGPTAPPQLKVSINFRLASRESRKILLDATFSTKSMAAENTQTAIVAGLEALLQAVDARAFRKIYSVL